jgi:hypothetical protein
MGFASSLVEQALVTQKDVAGAIEWITQLMYSPQGRKNSSGVNLFLIYLRRRGSFCGMCFSTHSNGNKRRTSSKSTIGKCEWIFFERVNLTFLSRETR